MLKRSIYFLLALFVIGCSGYELKGNRTLLRDPHFTEYKKAKDSLEREYLSKVIDYAEYVKQRDAIDAQYDKEVKIRDSKISD